MNMNFHDAIAICRVYGPPDLFVTFTCNPKWPKIADALRTDPGQRLHDRSDMECCVFKMKLDDLFSGIKEGTIFGLIHAGACMSIRLLLIVLFLCFY